jgi:hypothetical protein
VDRTRHDGEDLPGWQEHNAGGWRRATGRGTKKSP